MKHTVHVVLLHPTERSILALERDGRAHLPAVTVESAWLAMSGPLNDAVLDLLDADAFLLRSWLLRVGDGRSSVESAALMRLRAPVWSPPPGASWLPTDDLTRLPAAEQAIVASALAPTPPERAPWARSGWYDDAMAWALHAAMDAGYRIVGAVEQFKHWSLSSIWRIPTERGSLLFKAVPPIFAHEGVLTRLVGEAMPGAAPDVIATDRARGWMLMREVEGELLRDADAPRREEAVTLLAAVHRAFAGRGDELLRAGAPDRGVARLPGAASALLARHDVRASLSSDECRTLDTMAAELPARVEALAACGMPETLIHGDFHHGNIVQPPDGGVVFIDWTDGCLAHPLFDLATFLDNEDDAAGPELRRMYLEQWRDVVPAEQLERAATLAQPLSYWHHALNYQHIIDNIERGSVAEIGVGPEVWLRRVLALEGGAAATD